MKRALLGLVIVASAALVSTPQASAEGIEYCGITPRIPCGYCHYDPTSGKTTCVGLRYLDAS